MLRRSSSPEACGHASLRLRSPSTRGDQFVTVKVGVPRSLNASQKEALRQFAAAMGERDLSKASTGIFGKKKK